MSKVASLLKTTGGIAGLVAVLAILVSVNIILSSLRIRVDLTENQLYTLSAGSKALIGKLDRPVVLKLFFNSSAAEAPVPLKNHAREVWDLLKEYQIVGGRNVVIEKYDPKPDSEAEEWAQKYGLAPQSAGMFGPNLYFGLVAVAGDTEGAIPAIDPRQEQLLEYNITRLIYRVSHPQKPKIGVMSGLPVLGRQDMPYAMPGQPRPPASAPWLSFQDLRKDYDVREIPAGTESIDSDLQALIVVHPKNLADTTLYAIDQFVLRGGHLLAFVDPMSAADLELSPPQQAMFNMPQASSTLGRLFDAWGVDFSGDKVVADPRALTRVRNMANQVEESPVWLSLRKENMAGGDILTAELESLLMPFAGSFSDRTSEDIAFTPLIQASKSSGLVSAMSAQFGNQAIRGEMKAQGTAVNLAVRLTGTFRTAFPDGKPKREPKEGEPPAPEPAGEDLKSGTGTVILVGDVDMVSDRFCAQEVNFMGFKGHQPLNDNINFFLNAVEQIAGSTDLIGIRSRGEFDRPFDRVLALQEKATTAWRDQEKLLEERLSETQRQINEIEASKKDKSQRFILSAEQQQAIQNFRQEESRIRRELKNVRKSLRQDIERLGVSVKVVNIVMMPVLVSLVGVAFGLYRRRSR
jgi:ABC-type uncharacterized transport system involved in gliding motility auxiliary subunit